MAAPPSSVTWQRTVRVLATVVLVVLVIACLYWARTVLIPVAMAILLTFMLAPIVIRLQRRGLGRTPSVILVVAVVGLLAAGIAWLITAQVTALVNDLPQHEQRVHKKIADLRGTGKDSFLDKVQRFFGQVSQEIQKEEPAPAGASPSEKPQPVRIVADETKSPLTPYMTALEPVLEPLGGAGLVVVLVIFMLINREDLRGRVVSLIGTSRVTVTTKALDDAGQRISRFLLMQLVVNGTYGLAVGLGLFALGVPYAPLWGFLAAVLRYVPYLGPWLAALVPIALSLLVFDGWMRPLLVIGMYVVFELLSNMVMEPVLYGQSIGVSEPALLVAVAFWTWLWGAMGLVLSTPLTVCLVVLGKYVPHLKFFDVLLGDEPALDPNIGYYQRLLARDQDEASDIAEEQLVSAPLEQVYDELLIPALTYAQRDLQNDRVTEDDWHFIVRATGEIGEELGLLKRKPETGDEAPAPVAGKDGAAAGAPVLLLGCPARNETDEVALQLFGQLLDPAVCTVEMTTSDQLASEVVALVEEKSPALVCIAALPPGGLAHTRLLCMRLRGRFPDLEIMVGRWGLKGGVEKNQEQLQAAGADHVGTTLAESRNQVVQSVQHLRLVEVPAAEGAVSKK